MNFLSTDPEDPWINIMAPDKVGGAEWLDWALFLEKFIVDYGSLMERCPDDVKRFPAHISVIVLDNLNGSGVDYTSVEENKKEVKEGKRVTFDKFNNDIGKQDATIRLLDLLVQFRSTLLLSNGIIETLGYAECCGLHRKRHSRSGQAEENCDH